MTVTPAQLRDSEKSFQKKVIQLAHATGWKVMHVRRAMGKRDGKDAWQTPTSIKGWPDLFFYSPRRQQSFYRELKSESGRVTPEQQVCLDDLVVCGLDAKVWRPRDWDEIEATLKPQSPRSAKSSSS